MKRLTSEENLKELQEIAISRNGLLLSTAYINMQTKYNWKHIDCGSEWEATGNSVKNGRWCGRCNGTVKHDLNWLKSLPRDRGECLSDEYTNIGAQYKWRCFKCNHSWLAIANHIARGSWCPICSGHAVTDNYLETIGKEVGLICLDTQFNGVKSEYNWKCTKVGHEFKLIANKVQQGQGCLGCSSHQKKSIDKIRDIVKEKFNGDIKSDKYEDMHTKYEFICPRHGSFLTTARDVIYQEKWCPKCGHRISRQEIEIKEYLESIGVTNIIGQHRPFTGKDFRKSIDLFLPDLNIGIEHNGLRWHNEEKKGRTYHREKYLLSKEKGIRLIQIFGDEWSFRCDQVKAYLRAIVGKQQIKIGARQCQFREFNGNDNSQAKAFLNENHLQGAGKGHTFGLFYNDTIVAVMVMVKTNEHRKGKPVEGYWELSRYCIKMDYKINGGLAKMLSNFKKLYNPTTIVSYSDNRWSQGEMYKNNGFSLKHEVAINYFYINSKKERFNKSSFRKDRLANKYDNLDLDQSESALTEELGFDKIFDAGKIKWELKY